MARRREFNRDQVLQRAMDHFWEYGYEAASMRDLLGVMQIGRQSLYDTFGDKHSLLLACLAHYQDMGQRVVLAPLLAEDGGLPAIDRYFSSAARSMGTKPHRACFVVNSCIELAPHDPQVAAITAGFVTLLQGAFAHALQVANEQGDAQIDDVDAAGWRLTNAALGLSALSKAGVPPDSLSIVADEVTASLRT
jgi:TetR/AcrR family transcriptional regulator, transcriptional repressor for nem operon